MRLNTLHPAPGSRTKKKRLGRGVGSGLGKTWGKGSKGQKARAGGHGRAWFEGGQQPLQRRVPKFGFRSQLSLVTAEVRLGALNKVAGDVIDLAALKAAQLVRKDMKRARVMLSGSIDRAVTLKGLGVTRGARAAIEKAGGKVED